MLRKPIVGLVFFLATVALGICQETDVSDSSDHPLFTRMAGFYISDYSVKDFDTYESLMTGPDSTWAGKTTRIRYDLKTGAKQPSMTQIAQNYAAALRKIGGKVLVDQGRMIEGKIEKNGSVTYIHAEGFNDGGNYSLVIIEKGALQQEVVADAASLGASIASTGKVVVQGIYFEADKAIVKKESGPALDEVVKLLQQNPRLSLFVVGHTANVGNLDDSLRLSNDRAKAIVDALVDRGIAASRLKAVGIGPYSPAASNRTEEGRALNRRVELVEQ